MSAKSYQSNNGYINRSKGGSKLNKAKIFGVSAVVGVIFLAIAAFQLIGFVEVKGHQQAVVEKFYGSDKGVQEQLLSNGRHFYIPALSKPYVYNVGTDNFIMGKSEYYTNEGTDRVNFPALTIKCGGRGQEQPATFSITLQYQLDSTKLTKLHKRAQNQYRDRIIKPALTNIIKSLTVTQHVLDFYTGDGYNRLQSAIEEHIKSDPVLSELGIVVDTFVIDQIDLDPAYEREIQERQLATQKKLKEDELAKAAESAALKTQAVAKADKLKRIVEAEADKQEKVLAAEAANESKILAAKAAAEQKRLDASADRYRKEQDAKGLKAQGLAQAAVDRARKAARYDGIAGARQAAVEIEQAKTERMKGMNFNGVVTEKTLMMFSDGKNLNTPSVVVPTSEVGK